MPIMSEINSAENEALQTGEDASRLALHPTAVLLTGGIDRPYAFGLSMALVANGVALNIIGSQEVDSPEMHNTAGIQFHNFHGDPRRTVTVWQKVFRHLAAYKKILVYAAATKVKIFHILWNNKFQLFDRTILMMYYKALGKRIVFTAHNINAAKRDDKDSVLNRYSLKTQYRLVDHIFVHTEKMAGELTADFGVHREKISVIPFGINNSVPDTNLTSAEARRVLGFDPSHKIMLFFGAIRPYKGVEYLVQAFQHLAHKDDSYRLIIAGEFKKDSEDYWRNIQQEISASSCSSRILQEIRFIPDQETEIYFKAADVMVLPYTSVSQSGVLFLSYSFGLPVIATAVGSFPEEIAPGRQGYVCPPESAPDLEETIQKYFESTLYRELSERREEIKKTASSHNSWEDVAKITRGIYSKLLNAY